MVAAAQAKAEKMIIYSLLYGKSNICSDRGCYVRASTWVIRVNHIGA
jgi:hypothetical protein